MTRAAADAVFALAFAGLLAYELDAVDKREWRLLYVLRQVEEGRARRAFVPAHIPLVATLLWAPLADARTTSLALDAFMVVHAGLHARLSSRTETGFTGPLSLGLIYGTAAVAALHALLALWG